MIKNILILLLAIASGGLGYLHFGVPKPEPVAPIETAECDCPEPVVEEIEKITMTDAILAAPVHGLSLDTPLDEVDELLESASYECKKNDNRVNEDSSENRTTSWRCESTAYKSLLYIDAAGDEIQNIKRNGIATMQEMDEVLNQLDGLKLRLNSRKNVDIIQNKKTVMYHLNNINEDKSKSYAHYRFQYNQHKDDSVPKLSHDGTLAATLVR